MEAGSAEEIDKLVNEFEGKEGIRVRATQTHADMNKGIYTYVLFYTEED